MRGIHVTPLGPCVTLLTKPIVVENDFDDRISARIARAGCGSRCTSIF